MVEFAIRVLQRGTSLLKFTINKLSVPIFTFSTFIQGLYAVLSLERACLLVSVYVYTEVVSCRKCGENGSGS